MERKRKSQKLLEDRERIDKELCKENGLPQPTFRSVHANCGNLPRKNVPNLKGDQYFYDHNLGASFYLDRFVLKCPKHNVTSASAIDHRIS